MQNLYSASQRLSELDVPHQYEADICLSLPTFLIISYSNENIEAVIKHVPSGDLCLRSGFIGVCWYVHVMLWYDGPEQKSPTACVCWCVTGPCHSITGHTNLIIQLWAQRGGVSWRGPWSRRTQTSVCHHVTFCSVTIRVWADW